MNLLYVSPKDCQHAAVHLVSQFTNFYRSIVICIEGYEITGYPVYVFGMGCGWQGLSFA